MRFQPRRQEQPASVQGLELQVGAFGQAVQRVAADLAAVEPAFAERFTLQPDDGPGRRRGRLRRIGGQILADGERQGLDACLAPFEELPAGEQADALVRSGEDRRRILDGAPRLRHVEEQPRFVVALGEARIEEEQAAVGQEQVVPGQADGKFRGAALAQRLRRRQRQGR